MILKDSEEWASFLKNLSYSKSKSNRDVLCLKCWKIMKYEECVKHKLVQEDHVKSILTSKEFASEEKFMAVAKAMDKVRLTPEGLELYTNPYSNKERRGRPPMRLSLISSNEELKHKDDAEKLIA